MEFRQRLVETLRLVEPILEEAGVLVIGSEVPNLLEPGAASTLVVSEDVDLGIAVAAHKAVKDRLLRLPGLRPSPEEPSVWLPEQPGLLEINFVGFDDRILEPGDTYVLDDPDLPLLVIGPLSLLAEPGSTLHVDGLSIPVPRVSGLLLEKLITDRSAKKGDRDLLVAGALLAQAVPADLDELCARFAALPDEMRHAARSNLSVLSLLGPRAGMPDPRPQRARIAELLRRLEAAVAAPSRGDP